MCNFESLIFLSYEWFISIHILLRDANRFMALSNMWKSTNRIQFQIQRYTNRIKTLELWTTHKNNVMCWSKTNWDSFCEENRFFGWNRSMNISSKYWMTYRWQTRRNGSLQQQQTFENGMNFCKNCFPKSLDYKQTETFSSF